MRQRHAGPGLCPSLPPKAAGTNSDKKAGLTARLSANRPPVSRLEQGGVSRRLAPASRRSERRSPGLMPLMTTIRCRPKGGGVRGQRDKKTGKDGHNEGG